jgi:hypothetical protein
MVQLICIKELSNVVNQTPLYKKNGDKAWGTHLFESRKYVSENLSCYILIIM